MNISITNECNRRCDYCFQKSWYLSSKDIPKQEMPLEDISKLIDMECSDDGFRKCIKLMGGEPLLYSKLHQLMDMCVRKNVSVIFISNITIDTENLDNFLNKYKRNICGWLINSDYPDSQRELFLRNFKLFVDKEIEFSISTTLTPNSIQNMKSADRISELLNIIGEHKTDIRISPMTPNHIESSFYDYSMDVLLFLQKIWNVKMCEVNFDCTINCCEFSKDVLDFFRKTPQISFKTSMCDGCGAFDVLVDGSVVYCSSTKDIIRLDNIFEYNSIDEARKVMNDKWVKYWIDNSLACNYSSCGNFNPAYCMGVCPAKNSLWKEKLDGCAKAKA